MLFSSFALDTDLHRAVQTLGHTDTTDVQTQVIPLMLSGVDGIALAPTGSGKTLSFALPLLQRVIQHRHQQATLAQPSTRTTQALILVPTRELSAQIAQVFTALCDTLSTDKRAAPKVLALFGGVSLNPQMMALRGGADIVVATPGRLLDLVDNHALQLGHVAQLVLDEADRLMDASFSDELTRVLALLPAQRQTWLFSATWTKAVEGLSASQLRDPARVTLTHVDSDQPDILQRAIHINTDQRTSALRQLIKANGWKQVLVFVASKYNAEHLAEKLYLKKIYATPFHGGLTQGQRTERLAEFKDGRWDVLITTDLAARGIDIHDLPAVVNYDLPRSPNDYTHRIGRTARAGKSGVAVSFITPDTAPHFALIEKRHQLALPRETLEGFPYTPPVMAPAHTDISAPDLDAARGGAGGIKGSRLSKKDKARAAAKLAGTGDIKRG